MKTPRVYARRLYFDVEFNPFVELTIGTFEKCTKNPLGMIDVDDFSFNLSGQQLDEFINYCKVIKAEMEKMKREQAASEHD